MQATIETPAATATRFHVGLHVADLPRSVRFYRTLFGAAPAKDFDDYAKFDVAVPPLVLALYPSPQQPGGALNHVGLRFPDSAALVEVQRRLEEAGIATQRQEGVECCYSRQTKFWVTDPDRTLWEIYTLHEDIDHSGFDDPPAPLPQAAETVWQHRITDPLPDRVPHPDATLDEVMLEGTFNAAVPTERITKLLVDAHRALKPGGKVSVHGLVGDKPFPGTPKLPGMAALVQRVPVETEPLGALLRAGFGGLFYEKLGDIHCFSVNSVELRELRLHGWKAGLAVAPPAQPGVSHTAGAARATDGAQLGVSHTAGAARATDGSCAVMYKGPMEEVSCECGTAFRRGEKVVVSAMVAGWLRSGPAGEQFAFLS